MSLNLTSMQCPWCRIRITNTVQWSHHWFIWRHAYSCWLAHKGSVSTWTGPQLFGFIRFSFGHRGGDEQAVNNTLTYYWIKKKSLIEAVFVSYCLFIQTRNDVVHRLARFLRPPGELKADSHSQDGFALHKQRKFCCKCCWANGRLLFIMKHILTRIFWSQ